MKNKLMNLNSSEFQSELEKYSTPVLIDCRTEAENNDYRIPNAILIDYYQHDFYDKLGKLDKSQPTFIYCRRGVRSLDASNKMLELGFEKVINLKNGITEWTGEVEYPITDR